MRLASCQTALLRVIIHMAYYIAVCRGLWLFTLGGVFDRLYGYSWHSVGWFSQNTHRTWWRSFIQHSASERNEHKWNKHLSVKVKEFENLNRMNDMGLEPMAHRLKIYCSPNWANHSHSPCMVSRLPWLVMVDCIGGKATCDNCLYSVAGLVGFEPTDAGVKVLCLTTWR